MSNIKEEKQIALDKYWARQKEIEKILSETDPHKFPNTISDKTLSSEEKLEFVDKILENLRMDFSDAEHQIECHADTLPDSFRRTMCALDKIRNVMCMSIEEIDNMENRNKS